MSKAERMTPGQPMQRVGDLKKALDQFPDDWLLYVIVHQEPLAAEDIWEYGRAIPPGRPFALLGPRQTQADAPIVALETHGGPVLPLDPEGWMALIEIALRDELIPDVYARVLRNRHQRLMAERYHNEEG